MPKIAAYHPVVKIENGSKVEFIELDLDDFYPEAGIIRALKSAGARTGGEAVEAVRSGALVAQNSSELIDARILGSEAEPTLCIDWDKII